MKQFKICLAAKDLSTFKWFAIAIKIIVLQSQGRLAQRESKCFVKMPSNGNPVQTEAGSFLCRIKYYI